MINKKKSGRGKLKVRVTFNENISEEEEKAIWNDVFDILSRKRNRFPK